MKAQLLERLWQLAAAGAVIGVYALNSADVIPENVALAVLMFLGVGGSFTPVRKGE